jgi:hypothetical protein
MPKPWKTFNVDGFLFDPNIWTVSRDGAAVVIEQDIGNGKSRVIADPVFEGQSDIELIGAAIFECFADSGLARKN